MCDPIRRTVRLRHLHGFSVSATLARGRNHAIDVRSVPDVVDGARSWHRSAIGWFVEEGENRNALAAVHESLAGTKRTWRDVRLESAMRTKADVRRLWFYGFTRKVKSLWIRGVRSTCVYRKPYPEFLSDKIG
jgi:hypothetical protein